MIEHNVKEYLDAVLIEEFDHLLELIALAVIFNA